MFGYVRPQVSSLRVREYEWYRAVYCGLCRAMGSVSGQVSRLTLSYDFTFLALVRLILSDAEAVFVRHRCAVHPLRPRLMAEEHPALRYTAAAAAFLTEAKRQDDMADETGSARIKPALLAPVTGSMVHLTDRRAPEYAPLVPLIREHLDRLTALEKASCPSPDEAAQVFGVLLGELFCYGLSGSAAAVARSIGIGTGRFLYLCDAMDDLAEDIREHRYNPLALLWGDMALDAEGKPAEPVRSAFSTGTLLDLEKLALAVELLPGHPLTEIVKNIIYLGMPDVAGQIAAGHSPDRSRKLTTVSDSVPQTIHGSQP
ncbi:MAG: hypothetical protein IKY52_00150 [Clostridia bacterium]|nr:hypothetical protein [Clostridia bacterium]